MSRSHGKDRARHPGRKTLQLCAQVRHAIEFALTGELDDDVLRMLHVARVEPAPDASRMIVTVVPLMDDDDHDPVQILSHLHARAGAIRAAVAKDINRKKVPELMYKFADKTALLEEAGLDPTTASDPSEEE